MTDSLHMQRVTEQAERDVEIAIRNNVLADGLYTVLGPVSRAVDGTVASPVGATMGPKLAEVAGQCRE